MEINYETLLLDLARVASKLLKESLGDVSKLEIIAKSKLDVTRRIDLEVEKLIVERLKEENIPCIVYCEEEGLVNISGKEPKYVVVVDPLDGSLNYTLGFPWYAISIAIGKVKSKETYLSDLEAGIVYHVPYDKFYYADIEVKFRTNDYLIDYEKLLETPLIMMYVEPKSEKDFQKLKNILNLFTRYKVRTFGAASLEIINTILGKSTLFIDLRNRLRVVDIAATYVIAKILDVPMINEFGVDLGNLKVSLNTQTTVLTSRNKELLRRVIEVLRVE